MLGILSHPNIDPVIFTLWSNSSGEPVLALRWYGLMYVLAFMFGFLVFRWLQKTGYLRIKAADVTNIIVVGVLGTFLGGRLGYLLFYQFDKLFLGKGELTIGEKLAMVVKVWEGGMSFHGGVFGVGLAVLIYAWRKKQSFWNILDGAVHIVPFGVACVRVGNFINGELYGRVFKDDAGNTIYDPDKLPWYAMKFPTDHNDPIAAERLQSLMRQEYFAAHPDATRVPDAAMQPLPVKPEIWEQVSQYFPGRWPSQVVQFAFEGMLVLLLVWLLRRWFKRPGQLAGAFLMLYCICRIPAEMIRQPDMQVDPAKAEQLGGTAAFLASMGMTMGQFLSVVVFLIGLVWILAIYFKPFTGAEYTAEDRRPGFFKSTMRDLPEILGFRKPPKAEAKDKSEPEEGASDEKKEEPAPESS